MKINYGIIKSYIKQMIIILKDYNESHDSYFYRLFLIKSLELNEYVNNFDIKTISFVSKVEANILNKYINKLN